MSILVTGGAGYIGSHVTRLLQNKGTDVVVVDNLTSGSKSRISGVELIELELSAPEATSALIEAMTKHQVSGVIHFAAQKQVGVSMTDPEYYYEQNISGMNNLLKAMRAAGVTQLVFSSSAAAYGMPEVELVSEEVDCRPINPYGETKLIGEWMTRNAARAWGLRAANLRYFNVAGTGWVELADTAVMNLVPIVFDAIAQNRKPKVFGADYNTPDGSCIRDYVHVLDLAEAHLAALDYLQQDNRKFDVFNVGTGVGSSVFEVLSAVRKVSGIDFEAETVDRRAGDPPALTADVSRINQEFGWRARHNLNDIVASAWEAFQARN